MPNKWTQALKEALKQSDSAARKGRATPEVIAARKKLIDHRDTRHDLRQIEEVREDLSAYYTVIRGHDDEFEAPLPEAVAGVVEAAEELLELMDKTSEEDDPRLDGLIVALAKLKGEHGLTETPEARVGEVLMLPGSLVAVVELLLAELSLCGGSPDGAILERYASPLAEGLRAMTADPWATLLASYPWGEDEEINGGDVVDTINALRRDLGASQSQKVEVGEGGDYTPTPKDVDTWNLAGCVAYMKARGGIVQYPPGIHDYAAQLSITRQAIKRLILQDTETSPQEPKAGKVEEGAGGSD